MKKSILFLFFLIFVNASFSQQSAPPLNKYQKQFKKIYQTYPAIPEGILEAVSFTTTRFTHLDINEPESCTEIPRAFGVFGLVPDGKGYFRNNLLKIATLSGISSQEIIHTPEKHIKAYASAYNALLMQSNKKGFDKHVQVLIDLSELPNDGLIQDFALNSHLYSVLSFLNNKEYQETYQFPYYNIDLINIFGQENYDILSSSKITITEDQVKGNNGNTYTSSGLKSSDYGPAIWNPTTCNYSSRNGVAISAVTIHTVQGSYAGCISWFKNCSAGVSAHYVLRSSDGQVTQMVLESNKGWHVGTENPYTIGLEHEGYVNNTAWYTTAMYQSSADLVRDITQSGYGVNPLRTAYFPWAATTNYNSAGIPGNCVKIKGHQHYPNQSHTDPGANWNWKYFDNLINNTTPITTITSGSGTITDNGGSTGNYTGERQMILIQPSSATSITLNTVQFNLESTWDYLYIYDGSSVAASLIGVYTGTTIPSTITSSGGSLLIELRSDCATAAPGFEFNFTSSFTSNAPSNLAASTLGCPQISVNLSWTNSGSGWFIDVSTDPTFATYYNKDVSNLTSINCPGGFCDFPGCTSYLQFEPGTTYYWRIWDGIALTNGSSFTTPVCTTLDGNCSGSIDDSGGPGGNYNGNEDYTYTISPANANSVTVNFSGFDLETNFDSLYIYDGSSTAAPLIGSYTGLNSPGTVSSTAGPITLHFISDPFVNNAGFSATWNCTLLTTETDFASDFTSLNIYPNPASGKLNIEWNDKAFPASLKVVLFDHYGKEILNKTVQANTKNTVLDISTISRGIYFLLIETATGVHTEKIVKQ